MIEVTAAAIRQTVILILVIPARRTSSGSFATAPLLNLMLVSLDRQLSGSLVLTTPMDGKTEVVLRSGIVIDVRPASPVARLGELLSELHGISPNTIELAATTRSGPKLLGERLEQAGLITKEMLEGALREQLLRRTLWVGRLPSTTTYDFFQGDASADPNEQQQEAVMARVALDPLAQIWQFIKVNLAPAELNVALARLGSREVKLHPHSRVQRFGFSIKIQNLLDVVRSKPQTLDALHKAGLVDPDTLHRVLYTLAVTRHLDVGRDDLEPMAVGGPAKHSFAPRVDSGMQLRVGPSRVGVAPSSPSLPSAAPSSAPPRDEAALAERAKLNAGLREELKQLLGKLDSLNHYQLLALPEDAQVPAIQSAFLVLAKKWHPDRWRGDLADANRDASRVFARLREAYQTLIDDTLRAAYDEQRQSKQDEEAEQDLVRQILHAAGQFHQAQILAKKHDFAAAEELAHQAFQGDPTQLEYGAFYAWAAVQNPQRKEKDFDALVALLNHAVADSKDNMQLRYYRAVVLKRAGRLQEAIKDFQFVHEADPKHVEAAREIRLFAKRADEAREAREESGRSGAFIKKLFVK